MIPVKIPVKIPVAILGATGSVGQRFVELLSNHPWFEIASLCASEKSVGKPYGEAVNWLMSFPLSKAIAGQKIEPCLPGVKGKIAFSALDSGIAGEVEDAFAKAGYVVVSNASFHRMHESVPLLIPEVNSEHLQLLKSQRLPGMIVTNPNCSAIGLCLGLKPLYDAFGIEAVHVVTMQAVSGAGYPGVAGMDMMDNVIPYIKGEEAKLETEPLKILGRFESGKILSADFAISAQCNRVAVSDGHMECVSVKLKQKASFQDIIHAWKSFKGPSHCSNLPSAPEMPIHYLEGEANPQPRLHRSLDKSMAVAVGRLRNCSLFDFKFVLLSHNTVRGAAGGALYSAELMQADNRAFS